MPSSLSSVSALATAPSLFTGSPLLSTDKELPESTMYYLYCTYIIGIRIVLFLDDIFTLMKKLKHYSALARHCLSLTHVEVKILGPHLFRTRQKSQVGPTTCSAVKPSLSDFICQCRLHFFLSCFFAPLKWRLAFDDYPYPRHSLFLFQGRPLPTLTLPLSLGSSSGGGSLSSVPC